MISPVVKEAVVLVSGGMDSTVLSYWAIENGYSLRPLFIDYGQHCVAVELATVQSVLPLAARTALSVLRLNGVYDKSHSLLVREVDLWKEEVSAAQLYLPYRNLLLLTSAAAYAATVGASTVFAAFINSNHAPEIDATYEFLERVRLLAAGTGGISIEMPFRHLDKAEVARLGQTLGAPIDATFSCQVNSKAHCGCCPNCVDRLAAFTSLRSF